MKYNLKNFPLKVNQQGIDITLMTTPKLSKDDKKIIAIAEWKVGFEKELRKKLKFERDQAKTQDQEQQMVAHFLIDLIKETLGE